MKKILLGLLMTFSIIYFNGSEAQESIMDIIETTTEIDNSMYDYIDNEIDLKRTYRSGIEKFLQGLAQAFLNTQNGIAGKLLSQLPKPVKAWLSIKEEDESRANNFGDVLNAFRDDFHAVFPGTFWCGDGNVSRTNEDVGIFAQTDLCCRNHDTCPYSIPSSKTMGLLVNNGIFTRSACSCDFEFYKCLKNVSTLISGNIGTTYFNILRPQCFGYHYPIESCLRYDNVRRYDKKCFEYKLDDSQNKTLEWYDLPDF